MEEKLHAIVRFNVEGQLVCFCPYDNYLRGGCACRDEFDCPEALVEITVLPKSRPSEQHVNKIKTAEKKVTKNLKETTANLNRIKQGVSRLEKAIKGTKFRI